MAYVRTSGRYPNHIFIPYNAKIADITHADTNKHTLELANAAGTGAIAGETRKIVMVGLRAIRIAGTGSLNVWPNEGAFRAYIVTDGGSTTECVLAAGTNRLQYSLTVANDDWDLYCIGYVVEA